MIDGTVCLQSGWNDNGGSMKQVPIEEMILDSRAKSQKELQFVIRRRLVAVSDIIANPVWYGKQSLESLGNIGAYTGGSEYDYTDIDDVNYEENERLRELVEVFEFHGMLPVDGCIKNIVAIFTQHQVLTSRPNPHDKLQFQFIPYTNRPFCIYGNSLIDLIGDLAVVRSALLKNALSVLNNSSANAGQLFIPIDMLDSPAQKRNL